MRAPSSLLSSRDPTGTLQPQHLGPSKFIRQWIGLSAVGERVECEPYFPANGDWASSAELEVSTLTCGEITADVVQVGFRLKRKETQDLFDSEEMAAAFISVSLPAP